MYNFKVGDIVKLNKNVIEERIGHLPEWYIEDKLIITELTDRYDLQNYNIVRVDIGLPGMSVDNKRITSQWLVPDLKTLRKLKLEKLYERTIPL